MYLSDIMNYVSYVKLFQIQLGQMENGSSIRQQNCNLHIIFQLDVESFIPSNDGENDSIQRLVFSGQRLFHSVSLPMYSPEVPELFLICLSTNCELMTTLCPSSAMTAARKP